MRFINVLSLILLVGIVSSFVNIESGSKKLPAVEITKYDGTVVDIQEYTSKGNLSFVTFWASFCRPCHMEMDELKKVQDRWQKEYGIEIIAINVDRPRSFNRAKAMVSKRGWDFTHMRDKTSELSAEMRISSIPKSFIINGEGKIVYTSRGFAPDIIQKLEREIKKNI